MVSVIKIATTSCNCAALSRSLTHTGPATGWRLERSVPGRRAAVNPTFGGGTVEWLVMSGGGGAVVGWTGVDDGWRI